MENKLTIEELTKLLYAAKLEEVKSEKFLKVFNRAVEVFEEEDAAVDWIYDHYDPSLYNKTPRQAIIDGNEEEVLRILGRIEYGVYG
jgi:uncharacterized protein (DUF2384 family)